MQIVHNVQMSLGFNTSKIPNTYLVGVQKAGTTTLHDWLVQHPEIFGVSELKDFDFFSPPERSLKSGELLSKEFKAHKGETVVLQSCVNYILYPKSLRGIFNLEPNAKLIVILRNPVSRAFSAYQYFKKLNIEKRSLKEALLYEPKEGLEFSRFNSDFTYIEHGLYYKQLMDCFEIFPREQVLVLDFEDLKKEPENVLNKAYKFLAVSEGFETKLNVKNVTGSVRSSFINNLLTDSKLLKYPVKLASIFGMTPRKRKMIKQRLMDINTSKLNVKNAESFEADRRLISEKLASLFLPDAQKLDQLLGTNFSMRWFSNK